MAGLEPAHAVLEAAVLAAELHPYETENRPLGVTLRAAPGPGLLIVALPSCRPVGRLPIATQGSID
jgi:hypothetical protein